MSRLGALRESITMEGPEANGLSDDEYTLLVGTIEDLQGRKGRHNNTRLYRLFMRASKDGSVSDQARDATSFAWMIRATADERERGCPDALLSLPDWKFYELAIGGRILSLFDQMSYNRRWEFMDKGDKTLWIIPDYVYCKDGRILIIDAKYSKDWKYVRDCFYQARAYIDCFEGCNRAILAVSDMEDDFCGEYSS